MNIIEAKQNIFNLLKLSPIRIIASTAFVNNTFRLFEPYLKQSNEFADIRRPLRSHMPYDWLNSSMFGRRK